MAKRASRLTALAVLMIGPIVPLSAWADDVAATSSSPSAQKAEPRSEASEDTSDAAVAARRQRQLFRVDLGVSIPSGALGGVGSGASAGPLGWAPVVETAFELHLAGPVWGFARAKGSYWNHDDCCSKNVVWSAGGDLGVRVEAPVFRWLEVGGHVLLGVEVERSVQEASFGSLEQQALDGAGVIGLSAHLRPTDFFGVRLSVDLFSAGHTQASLEGNVPGTDEVVSQSESATYAQWTASPRVELTYTF